VKRGLLISALVLVVVGAVIYGIVVLVGGPGLPPAATPSSTVPSTRSPSAPTTKPPKGVKRNPFGAMGCGTECAAQLDVRFYRPFAVLLQDTTTSPDATQFADAGYRLVLTVKNNTDRQASVFPSNLGDYRSRIGQVIDHYRSSLAVLAIENEERSMPMFNGTYQQYRQMLTVACEEAHARGVKCTNGGLLSQDIVFWVYERLVEEGRQEEANQYWDSAAREGLPKDQAAAMASQVQPWIQNAAAAGADYFNFHAYYNDGRGLAIAADALRRYTGLPVIVNEMGVRINDPAVARSLCEGVLQAQLPIAIWYTSQTRPFGTALVNPNRSLNALGEAIASCIRSHFASG